LSVRISGRWRSPGLQTTTIWAATDAEFEADDAAELVW
jgi:hypothetical protein